MQLNCELRTFGGFNFLTVNINIYIICTVALISNANYVIHIYVSLGGGPNVENLSTEKEAKKKRAWV